MKRHFLFLLINGFFISLFILAGEILMPFIFGFIFAYMLNPFVSYLEKYHIPRCISSFILVLALILLIGIFIIMFIPYLFKELNNLFLALPSIGNFFTSTILPKLASLSEDFFSVDIQEFIREQFNFIDITKKLLNMTNIGLSKVVNSGIAIFSIFSLWIISPILAFYFLTDWEVISKAIRDFIPRKYTSIFSSVTEDIDNILSGYLRGQLMLCVITSLYYIIALSIYGLKNALLIGVISGFFTILPYIGATISATIAIIFSIIQFASIESGVVILIIYVIGQSIESNILAPKLIGDKINLNPIWLIFALLLGGKLLGFTGLLAAVPVAAVLGVLIRHVVAYYYTTSAYLNLKA